MDESGSHSHRSGQDPAGELAALEAAQRRLWATLRMEDDPELRMSMLSQFSENRAAVGRLRASLGLREPQSNGSAPKFQVRVMGSASQELPPPSRLPYPSESDPVALPGYEDAADERFASAVELEHPGSDSVEADPAVRFAPGEPYVADVDQTPDFMAPPSQNGGLARTPRLSSEPAGEPALRSSTLNGGPASRRPPSIDYLPPPPIAPQTTAAHSVDSDVKISSASDAEAQAGRGALGGLVPEGTTEQLKASFEQVPRRVLWLTGGAVALLGLIWLVTLVPFGSDNRQNDDAIGGTVVAGPSLSQDNLSASLAELGYRGIEVNDDGETIRLAGIVASDAERAAVVGATRALTQGRVVDESALVVAGEQAGAASGNAPLSPTDAGGRPAAMQAELDRVVASTPIIFDSNEATLTGLHVRILNSVASIMRAYPDIPVSIVGFTDGQGSDAGNRELSLGRADAVRAYLISQGIPESSIVAEALGEETSSGSAAIASLERRVEFRVAASVSPALAPNDQLLKIAIVAPSARNDLAFTQSMIDAANVIAAERGNVEVAITDSTFVPEEAAAALRNYAAQDYDLVIAHGSQFGSALIDIAGEYPDVAFAWGTASDTFGLPNVYAYDAAAGEGGFVMGAMAAALSQSGVVGVVGPIEVGDAQSYVNGFVAGARNEKPDITVPVAYTGSFSDLTLAAEAARSHVGVGADVMTGSAQMVVGAVSIASESNALWFGTQSNQTELAPSLVVASQVYHWEVILREIIADVDSATITGQSYSANLANGGLVIEYNPGYRLADPVRQRADQLIAGIINGSVVVPS